MMKISGACQSGVRVCVKGITPSLTNKRERAGQWGDMAGRAGIGCKATVFWVNGFVISGLFYLKRYKINHKNLLCTVDIVILPCK